MVKKSIKEPKEDLLDFAKEWPNLDLPAQVVEIMEGAKSIWVPNNREDLFNWSLGREVGHTDWSLANRQDTGIFNVRYEVTGKGLVDEVVVMKARNGLNVNYVDTYMRRRDPNAMVIGDALPTDQPTYKKRFKTDFAPVRLATFDWLKSQDLIVMPFYAGPESFGFYSLLLCPKNAGFFAASLADLQGMIPGNQLPADFKIKGGLVYVAPPFRHTHFGGKQVVVHNRMQDAHEVFSYNLYPGPSAKKGIYSVLINLGEKQGWVTNHCSAVQVVTPYDIIVTIMHEGASGGGKSEMLEHIHRQDDGRLLLGTNTLTSEKRYLTLPLSCQLHPMMDDMGAAHPSINQGQTRLNLMDAEKGWFMRVDHITQYGTDPHLERLTISPKEPLIFLNHHNIPGGLALIWEHIEDAPGKPCPNPRVIIPRRLMPDTLEGSVEINVRSFGVRCPPCTMQKPTYGIMGLFHILPPALSWLWRLVAPRGYANPSIVDSKGTMESEGVGSYWAFCTGRRVDQANLLLKQIISTPETRHVLIPHQHIGAWKVGYMSEWITREYLARRGGARFRPDQLMNSRCALLGRTLWHMQIEGSLVPRWFLQVETQPEVGEEAYDAGAKELTEFFHRELKQFLTPDMDPLGRKIIECCLRGGDLDEYDSLIKA
jgi:hypothetical protein